MPAIEYDSNEVEGGHEFVFPNVKGKPSSDIANWTKLLLKRDVSPEELTFLEHDGNGVKVFVPSK